MESQPQEQGLIAPPSSSSLCKGSQRLLLGLSWGSYHLDIVPLGKSFAQAHGFLWSPLTDDRKSLGQFFKVALEAGWGEDYEYPGGDRSLIPERVLAPARNEDKSSCRSLDDLFVCLEPERALQHVESLIGDPMDVQGWARQT